MWPFEKIKKWLKERREKKIAKKNLAAINRITKKIEGIIAKDEEFILKNQEELKTAMLTLKAYPHILKNLKPLFHLEDLLNKPIDKEGLTAHIAKNVPYKLVNKKLHKKYVSFWQALDNFKKIIHTDYTNPDASPNMADLGLALEDLKEYRQRLEEVGLSNLARLVDHYSPDDLFEEKINPIKKEMNQIVDKALKTLKDVLEGDNSASQNKTKINLAMSTLQRYPELLEERKMSYLIPFVNGNLYGGSLNYSIQKAIPPIMAEELIRTGDFTPLATERISTANVTANNINIMYKEDNSGERRCFDATKEFLIQEGMEPDLAFKAAEHIRTEHPLLLSVAALNNIEQKNAASSIITQRDGFDLEHYQKEVQFVKTTRKTLAKIARNEESIFNNRNLLGLNRQAHEIRDYYAQIPQDPKNPEGRKILSGKEKIRSASAPPLTKQIIPDKTPQISKESARTKSNSI